MRKRIARLSSNLLNPFLVCFFCIIFITLASADSVLNALKWAAIALAFSVLPVFIFILYQVRRRKLDSIFPEPPRQRRTIYALASLVAAAGCIVTRWFEAPQLLAVSFIAGLVATVIFMAINMYWKISLHTAFVAAVATILTITYGVKAAWVFLLLLPVAWARLELKMHTPWQVITGAVLAVLIVMGISWGFGMVG